MHGAGAARPRMGLEERRLAPRPAIAEQGCEAPVPKAPESNGALSKSTRCNQRLHDWPKASVQTTGEAAGLDQCSRRGGTKIDFDG
eukprot:3595141-Pyramimonas_sp.AAC.1